MTHPSDIAMTDTRDELVKHVDLLEGGLQLLLATARAADPHPEIAWRVEEELRQIARLRPLLESDGKRIAELEADLAAVSKWHSESSKENDELQLSLTEARRERDEERERHQWRTIDDDTPKDCNVIVLDEGVASEAYYNGESDSWWLANTSEHDFDPARAIYPTHWQPLPDAAAIRAGNKEG